MATIFHFVPGGVVFTPETARYWYDAYGAHISTDRCGDVHVQAVSFEYLDDPDEAIDDQLRAEYPDLSADEREALIALARKVWDAANSIESLLIEAHDACRARDMDACVAALASAQEVENEHGDWPATRALREALIVEHDRDDLAVVETMPSHLRTSHTAAGNSGQWPHNGACRYAVPQEMADEIAEDDEWTVCVDGADPAEYPFVEHLPE